MADHITHDSGTKAVSSPDGKGQGCASTKRAYVKPELIILDGDAGTGRTGARGTTQSKFLGPRSEFTVPKPGGVGTNHFGPS